MRRYNIGGAYYTFYRIYHLKTVVITQLKTDGTSATTMVLHTCKK